MRKLSIRSLILLSLVLAAAAFAYFRYGPQSAAEHKPLWRSVNLDRGDIRQSITANGTLNPVVLVNVGTQVSGPILKLYVDFNDPVKESQVLAELDPRLVQAQLQQSQAALDSNRASLKLAQANERRARELYGKDYIPRSELDQAIQALEAARAQIHAAESQVQRDQTNLGYTVIRSPVSGVVISRTVDVGQTVAASFQTPTLFTIAQDLKRMQIDTSVAEADVGGVKVGQQVQFSVDAHPEREFHGQVRQIRLNAVNVQNVVTYNVVIDVDNSDLLLLPAMTAFVHITTAERKDVPRLPLQALRYLPEGREAPAAPAGNKPIWLVRGKVAEVSFVRLGINDGRYAELLSEPPDAPVILEDQKESGKSGSGQPGGNFRMRPF